MLQVASVLCTVLALSCALPHHKWHWSRPDHHSAKTAAKAQDHEWHWNKHQFTANSHLQSLTATVQDASVLRENACESVVGRLDQNGVNIRRSYHLCSQENPEPELEDVVACFYSTAVCCFGTGLPVDNATIRVNDINVTVKFYSTSNQTDLCYTVIPEKVVTPCITAPNCIESCTDVDRVCFNNTVNGDESSCFNLICDCKEGYKPPQSCCELECVQGFSNVNGTCEPLCIENCEIPDRVLGCLKCRTGYAPNQTCCDCYEDFYATVDGFCLPPCVDNIVGCQDGVCTCKAGFGGPDCCQCRDNAVSCTDDACECQPGYAAPTCCECAPGYYRAADGTCQRPCTDNVVSCLNGACTCESRFGGPDCCQCRDFAVANTCTDTACECQEGYAAPTCCECAPGYYRAADGTCQRPCTDNVISCLNGVCTCESGFGGPDCCQCRDFAVANTCTDTACECQEGYAAPTCCECAPGYYRAADRTCKLPCSNNTVSCQNGVCTCQTGFGGPGCCQCRDFAVINSCTDTACECQEGYAAPTCCECDDNYYRDPDGTCKEICVDTAVTCTESGCTECKTGYVGLGCCDCAPGFSRDENDDCISDCSDVQDIYFVVDTTLSNDASPFCTEMYAVELLTEAINPRMGNSEATRIGSYLYPKEIESPENDMRYFKVGDRSCSDSVDEFHVLMEAVSRGINNDVRDKVLGSITLPARVLDLLARDIEAEIASGNVPADQRRIVVILTDGPNDSSEDDLSNAIQRLVKTSDKLTLIAAGIATELNTNDKERFMSEIIEMANGDARNAIVAETSAQLGEELVKVMVNNGAICPNRSTEIINRLNDNGEAYCKCNFRTGCKNVCADPQACRTPPTALCSAVAVKTQEQEDSLTKKILSRVEKVLKGYFD